MSLVFETDCLVTRMESVAEFLFISERRMLHNEIIMITYFVVNLCYMLKKIAFRYYQLKYSLRWLFKKKKCVVINAVFALKGHSLLSNNWGDDINYILPQLIASKGCIPYSILFNCIRKRVETNIMCVGSVIPWLVNPKSIIWGSGVVDDTLPLNTVPLKVLSVRGPLTREYLLKHNVECPEVYGDPALLFPKYYQPNVSKKYKLGIIPHVVDLNKIKLSEFEDIGQVQIINISDYKRDWRSFIDKVNECETIISSSLHGLIISEAYQIPSLWVKWSDDIIGGDFKYNDFYLSIGKRDLTPLDLRNSSWKKENMEQLLKNWAPGYINLNPMLENCPFK